MPVTYRLTRAAYRETAFSGEGAKRVDGRWHQAGLPVVYTADTPALALLETLVHAHLPDLLEGDYVLIRIDVAEQHIAELSRLPEDWQDWPWPASTQRIGESWFRHEASPVLRVPSAVVPLQHNYLLNPMHPQFQELEAGAPLAFYVDARLGYRLDR